MNRPGSDGGRKVAGSISGQVCRHNRYRERVWPIARDDRMAIRGCQARVPKPLVKISALSRGAFTCFIAGVAGYGSC